MSPALDMNQADSDWHTIRDYGDYSSETDTAPTIRPQLPQQRKTVRLAFSALHKQQQGQLGGQRRLQKRSTMPIPSTTSLLELAYAPQPQCRPSGSFISSSSLYSDITEPIFDEQCFGGPRNNTAAPNGIDYTASRVSSTEVDDKRLLPKAKTSSSASLDRFKYDDDPYSVFLKPDRERDVSKVLQSLDTNSTVPFPPESAIGRMSRGESAVGVPFYNSDAVPSA